MKVKKTVAHKEVAVHIGNVEVDSGMVLIVDPCRAREQEKLGHGPGRVDYDKAMDFAYSTESLAPKVCSTCRDALVKQKLHFVPASTPVPPTSPFSISKALSQIKPHLHRQLTEAEHRQVGYGVVSSTSIGDGTFPVYAIVRGRDILRLEIDFER